MQFDAVPHQVAVWVASGNRPNDMTQLWVKNDLLAQLTHQGPGFNHNKEHIINTS
jgi:hypothetical protein